jgi:5-oxoprolinase (ATP-hydrolysing) subunit A
VLDPQRAVEQALQLARSGRCDTICIHGDTPRAAQIAAAVRKAFAAAGIATSRLHGRR